MSTCITEQSTNSYQEIRNPAAILLPPRGISPVLLWDNTDTTAGLPRRELRRAGPLGDRAPGQQGHCSVPLGVHKEQLCSEEPCQRLF